MAQRAVEHPREPLTRARILETAVRIMDSEGLEAVTMRRLGRELGVEAMSLYNHVEGRDDLRQGIVETVFKDFPVPEPGDGDWTERTRAMAVSFRVLLLAHPDVINLLSENLGPMRDPDALLVIETVFETLRGGGLSVEETMHAYHALVGYVMGYATLEIAGLGSAQAEKWPAMEEWVSQIPVERFPRLVEMYPQLARCDEQVEFQFGLDVMLEGLRAKLGPRA
jgi:AcrR family transcriptional regulator